MPGSGSSKPPLGATPSTQKSIPPHSKAKDGWQVVKKRKFSSSPESQAAAPESGNNFNTLESLNKPVTLHNRFNLLTDNVGGSSSTNSDTSKPANDIPDERPEPKAVKPPPIFIQGVTCFKSMVEALAKFIDKSSFNTKALANDVVKITVDSPDNFRKIVKGLKDSNIAFYTYQLKSERAFKVIIRNLHHTVETSEIKSALVENGYSVRTVFNIRHPRTKQLLPLFSVDLEPNDTNKSIYELRTLLSTRIQVETPRPRQEIVQCKRCQGFGHTRAYCTLPYTCVKCGGEHDNRTCTKSPEQKPNCGLCGGEHTANYRGCKKYQDQLRSLQSRAAPNYTQNPNSATVLQPTTKSWRSNHTYATIASTGITQQLPSNVTQEPTAPTLNAPSKIESLLEKVLMQNTQIMELLATLLTKVIQLLK